MADWGFFFLATCVANNTCVHYAEIQMNKNIYSKGRVAVTDGAKILALPKFTPPPHPPNPGTQQQQRVKISLV